MDLNEPDSRVEADDGIWPPRPSGQPQPAEPKQSWWARLFAIPSGAASEREVVGWWEARRLTYNGLVFGFGIPSFALYLFFLLTSGQLPSNEDAVEPLELLFAPIIVPLGVNICYTFGRLAELLWRLLSKSESRKAGQLLMQAGIAFTFFVIFLPSVTWGIIWFQHIVILRR